MRKAQIIKIGDDEKKSVHVKEENLQPFWNKTDVLTSVLQHNCGLLFLFYENTARQ